MNSKNLLIGIVCIVSGIALFAVYDQLIKPEREAREILAEGKLIMERGDKESLNQSLNSYSKIIVHYPKSSSAPDAYFLMGNVYDKLGLYRLAYLRYSYLLKPPLSGKIDTQMRADVITKLAKLKMMRSYNEEGLNQLYTLLNNTQNGELRSRIYSELGQAYLRNGEITRAKNSFDIAVQENSSNEEAMLGKARVCIRSGDYENAFAMYDYFLKYFGAVSPYAADVRSAYLQQLYHAGIAAYRAGNYSRSVDLMNRFNQKFSSSKYTENATYWIGESYFSMKQFDKANSAFDKVLSNEFYNKDQDARIKKGYAYFTSRRFDLAAKEFQTYIREYPRGKYADEARRWKDMSAQELRYRIERVKIPETEIEDIDQEKPQQAEQPKNNSMKEQPKDVLDGSNGTEPETPKDDESRDRESVADSHGDEEVSGVSGEPIQLDNVTEM